MPVSAGLPDLLPLIPPILNAQLTITPAGSSTPVALAETRIAGSDDPTYGTIGWVPRTDGQPFALVMSGLETEDDQLEPNRIHTTAHVEIYVALAHADTPAAIINFNDQCSRWIASARQVMASNRRLGATPALYIVSGDIKWRFRTGQPSPRYDILGIPYYCARLLTMLSFVTLVDYAQ